MFCDEQLVLWNGRASSGFIIATCSPGTSSSSGPCNGTKPYATQKIRKIEVASITQCGEISRVVFSAVLRTIVVSDCKIIIPKSDVQHTRLRLYSSSPFDSFLTSLSSMYGNQYLVFRGSRRYFPREALAIGRGY